MGLLLVFLVVPVGLYLMYGRGRALSWGLLPKGEEMRGDSAYRQVKVKTWKRGEAPWAVRLAALSSFFLGQMIVPGALVALLGLVLLAESLGHKDGSVFLAVLLLSAPTGLVVAAFLLSAGSAMLGRAEDAIRKARRAVRWALWHNVVLLAALGIGAAVAPAQATYAVGPAFYACFSIAQALLVRRAAQAMEAYASRQEADPAPVQAELEILHHIG